MEFSWEVGHRARRCPRLLAASHQQHDDDDDEDEADAAADIEAIGKDGNECEMHGVPFSWEGGESALM